MRDDICPECKKQMRPVGFMGHILRYHCDECHPLNMPIEYTDKGAIYADD